MIMTDEHALIGNEQGQLQLIKLDSARTTRKITEHTSQINCIAYCPELSIVITGSRDKAMRKWNVATGECMQVIKGHTRRVWCAAVHGTTYVNCTLLMVD